MLPSLCDEALRLGRIVAVLMPQEAEVHGLLALMEIQASRAAARIDDNGAQVLLLEQNSARWDQRLIRRGRAALDRADKIGGTRGLYALQDEIHACHAPGSNADQTDATSMPAYEDKPH